MSRPHRHVSHDWRTFDELLGYEVKREGSIVSIRVKATGRIVTLDLAEFNALRGTGPKPGGLQ